MKDGTLHTIQESVASVVRAEWIVAQYRAEGYTVTIKTPEEN